MTTPSSDYRRTGHRNPAKLLKGLDAAVNGLSGIHSRRHGILKTLQKDAETVDALAPTYVTLSDHHLRERVVEFREKFRRGERGLPGLALPALAAIREAADRQLGLRPFLVQLMGALALHRGFLAEMATGEGKTLVAGLAAVLAGWTKHPCHIITVNDYLVQRDAEWLGRLYSFCGIKVGFVTAAMNPNERRAGYDCDVTYGTSKEILADFLRDRLQMGVVNNPTRRLIRQMLRPDAATNGAMVMRGLHTAIVDEADSILIDEAVTPLIISTQHRNEALREVVEAAQELVRDLAPELDYKVNPRYREVELTPAGSAKLAQRCSSLPGIWRGPERRLELVKQALCAREFFLRDKQYVLAEDKVVIVDEFTGRPMPQRTWRQGLHQAIEAKEGLPVSDPTETVARLSFQRYFRLYHKLSGMTGTAREAAGEFWQIYSLPVIRIPTNRPCVREHYPDRIFIREEAKWRAILEEIERLHRTGRPVLIGTRSVAASERLGSMLAQRNLHFRLLNAVRHQEEAAIVAEAGQLGQITIATNMAGRGTDIKLSPGVAKLGGLHVIASERHESGRVDRQLFGRAARQGDPGSAQAYVSTEDELLRRHLPRILQRNVQAYVERGLPGGRRLGTSAIYVAQRKAQRLAFHQRKGVLRTDEWLEDSLSFASVPGVG
jgi:preprotein translocase subunit SecA